MTQDGDFVWYELMTTDTKAAQAFYAEVVGWKMAGYPGGMDYTVLNVGEAGVGGIMGLTPEMLAGGARPGWIGYINVSDCDATTAKLAAAGGKVHRPPSDIPDIGRFAVVADPQGAVFTLFQVTPRPAPPGPPADAAGVIGWRELMAADRESAFDFYAGLFGWKKAQTFDMGAHGLYQIFTTPGVAQPNCGVMSIPPGFEAPPHWAYYIQVNGAKAAVERLTGAGGKVLNGPMQVPTGQWVVQAMDPQGAMFGLLSTAA